MVGAAQSGAFGPLLTLRPWEGSRRRGTYLLNGGSMKMKMWGVWLEMMILMRTQTLVSFKEAESLRNDPPKHKNGRLDTSSKRPSPHGPG